MKKRVARKRLGTSVLAVAAAFLIGEPASALPASERNVTRSSEARVSPVVLFFEPGRSEIPSSARPVANRVLAEGKREWRWHLQLEPYIAAEGGEEARTLAEERARNLAAFLSANGIPESRVAPGPVRITEAWDPGFGIAGERVEIRFRPVDDPLVADLRQLEADIAPADSG